MLVLTRKANQQILIGDDIVITIVDINSRGDGKVKIGIEAPKHVRVDRLEVREAIRRQGVDARSTVEDASAPPLVRMIAEVEETA